MQKNRDTQFTVRCDDKMRAEVEQRAQEAGQSVVEWIRRAIQKELDYLRESGTAGEGAEIDNVTTALLKALDDPAVRAVIKEKLKD